MKRIIEKKWWALVGVSMSGIIVALDFTIVNTVLPNIQSQFSSSMNNLQWVMTGFGITFSAFLVSAGRLGDLLGRRLLLYIGIIGFGLASLGAGLSLNIWQLILARLLQGVFASAIFPCGLAITADAFKKVGQARAIGIYGSFLGIGMAAGPVLGGLIASFTNWRWVFLINLPVVLISMLICIFNVDESRIEQKIAIDWIGMTLISLGLGALVFGVTESQAYGWHSMVIIIPLIIAIVLFVSLFLVESKIKEPLLPPALFLNHPFFIGVVVYVVGISFVWSILFFVPLYLQDILKFDTAVTGLLLLPMTAMTAIMPPICGYMLYKKGAFIAAMFVFSTGILGLLLFLFISTTFSLSLILTAFICVGLSWGAANGIAIPLALSHPENQKNEGLISGAAVTILNVVGVVSLSVAGTLFHSIERKQLLAGHSAPAAFMSGFHAVMTMLLILTIIFLFAVLKAFRGMQQK